MGSAYFYHLTQSPIEKTLPQLLAKALEAGWRVEVRGTDKARLDWLDTRLWQEADDSFLPHGVAGGPQDADQPILLTIQGAGGAANQPHCLVSVDGAALSPDEVTQSQRAIIIFDGADGAALQTARGHWKRLTDEGCAAVYWAQDDSRKWIKKVEKDAQ